MWRVTVSGDDFWVLGEVVYHFVGEEDGVPFVTAVDTTDEDDVVGAVVEGVVVDGALFEGVAEGGKGVGERGMGGMGWCWGVGGKGGNRNGVGDGVCRGYELNDGGFGRRGEGR